MVATVGWTPPPSTAPPPGYAAGEESQEKHVQYVRCSLTPPVHYGPGAPHIFHSGFRVRISCALVADAARPLRPRCATHLSFQGLGLERFRV